MHILEFIVQSSVSAYTTDTLTRNWTTTWNGLMHACSYISLLSIIIISIVIDINECRNIADCEQMCVNERGSFHCDCTAGYRLNSDGISCKGERVVSCNQIIQ